MEPKTLPNPLFAPFFGAFFLTRNLHRLFIDLFAYFVLFFESSTCTKPLFFLAKMLYFIKFVFLRQMQKNLEKTSQKPPEILPKSMKNRKKSIKKAMMAPGAPKMRKKFEK